MMKKKKELDGQLEIFLVGVYRIEQREVFQQLSHFLFFHVVSNAVTGAEPASIPFSQ